ncbi:glutamate-1-semialdehyde 2,1-aminomutase [Paraburkholderia sp. BL27I4N3]|uniref:aminotransferase class III-fold pyridoxal phosphate-dependent enzyme n=1 Tax=Paraburkholderia sp. BL27I4N3 TaxID=1938805 RepID=UPI000E250C3C|nr:aminotransferase class III-fold pyridoxal phosphate-dependent enzyme [Paraburkholderia sp. BL27I4N3]REE06480.1 glutamate-1-semialdehyde 2,1-aminomutase [Paraburkholderia sp. BL27I4N3]
MTNDQVLRKRALEVIPNGMYGHENVGWLPEGYPQFFARADGARLWDTDGNEYIDYLCAFGPSLFGYNETSVTSAALAQLKNGDTMTGPGPVMVELAEKFVSAVEHATWTMFCKNGTDATTMAMVTARAHRGRKKILVAKGAYHGAAPWCVPSPEGITPEDRANLVQFEYNNVESLRQALEANAGNVAGVFATPFRHEVFEDQIEPTADYAQKTRGLCNEFDTLLIIDEVRTGFRLARGCSWEAFGVRPDLSTWGKALANGYPISALAGSENVREAAKKIFVTGSYWFSAVPMAAALQTLDLIATTGYLEKTVRLGKALRAGLAEQAARHGFDLRQTGPVQMPQMLFADDKDQAIGRAWMLEILRRGSYMHPFHNMFLNAAMTETDIELTLEATEAAFKAIKVTA